jgi:hypothetical protein
MSIICIKNHYVLDLPFYLCFSHHYEYLYDLVALGEDAVETNLGDCTGFDSGYF